MKKPTVEDMMTFIKDLEDNDRMECVLLDVTGKFIERDSMNEIIVDPKWNRYVLSSLGEFGEPEFQPDHNLDEDDIKQLKEDFPNHWIDCVDGKLWAYMRDKPYEVVEIDQCSECGHYFNLEEVVFLYGLMYGGCDYCCVQ